MTLLTKIARIATNKRWAVTWVAGLVLHLPLGAANWAVPISRQQAAALQKEAQRLVAISSFVEAEAAYNALIQFDPADQALLLSRGTSARGSTASMRHGPISCPLSEPIRRAFPP